ncbi:hypothetical protein [Zestomonas carbonaria]|uniref:Uncharacterized protein n=1 Tax=Zestomonas carbonaria TaxID=2762745 RepID=A0A7U7I8J8_9GAMM|nr:hypothetical protein [Pseudomonas carbonaria]CAD5107216.1 hypothetical protein PSEWESI4_01487 [Pseudomonas carbonaria]
MSDIEVDGNRNRVAGRDYIELTLPCAKEEERLSQVQRQMLRSLVEEVASECEVEARTLWREVVHARVGVEHVGDIPRSKFLEAQDAVVCWRDNHRAQANIRLMVSRITNITKNKGIYSERDAWCLRQFGEKHLNAMGKDQLRLVLAFVEDFSVEPAAKVVAPPVEQPLTYTQRMKKLVTNYPSHMLAVLLLGFVIGKIF